MYLRYRREDVVDLIQMLGKVWGWEWLHAEGFALQWRPAELSSERRENWEQIGTKNLLLRGIGGLPGRECSQPQSGLSCDLF